MTDQADTPIKVNDDEDLSSQTLNNPNRIKSKVPYFLDTWCEELRGWATYELAGNY